MFKTRLGIVAVLLGICFVVIFCRLWLLQVTRYDQYAALASRDKNMEKMVASIRGPIFDRFGDALAYDEPFYDLSVRVERLHLTSVTLDEVREVREKIKDAKERDAAFDRIIEKLAGERYVMDLARTVDRPELEIAAGVLKALDTVARKWASGRAPLKIVNGIDEKTWLGLRAIHDDVFRDSYKMLGKAADALSDTQEPPFPGLVCTVSTRRVYPRGKLACFVLGSVGELSAEDDNDLRQDGILLENPDIRRRQWDEVRSTLNDAAADRLDPFFHGDIREMPLGQVFTTVANLRPSDQQRVAALGLSDMVHWTERPPRIALAETEMLWLGINMPISAAKNILPSRICGDMGVERFRNALLRDKAGMKIRGDYFREDEEGGIDYRKDSQPRAGDALALTISIPWQEAVERALHAQGHNGAIVVMDVHTGEVLAMASNPDFDPNVFVPPRDNPERQAKIAELLGDTDRKPLLNRAIAQQYPLGSIMKTLVAAVALDKGVNPNETIECKGFMKEGGQVYHCDDGHAHGIVNLTKGLRCSCNMYYMQLGARIGVEGLAPFAKLILGKRSGIDLPSEAPGIFPDRDWRQKHYANDAARAWPRGQDYLLAIGQGQMTSTVVQAAQLMAAVANNGSVLTPHVWLDAPQVPARALGISSSSLAMVRQGLEEVVNCGRPGEKGTAYTPFHENGELSVKVAGKTSTAEHGHNETPHAWFAGYAPADNPQIAFAIVLEDAGHGGATAGPVAYQFLREMYGTKNNPKGRAVAGGE